MRQGWEKLGFEKVGFGAGAGAETVALKIWD